MHQTNLYPKGTVLFSQRQSPAGVFVLCSGRVKLTTTSRQGRSVIVRVVEQGEVLGLSAVISNQPHKVSAQTLELSEACFIARPDFLRFWQTWRETSLHVGRHLSMELQRAYEQVALIALTSSAQAKLASLLLEWASSGTRLSESEVLIQLDLTHEEVGELIGIRRQTVTRLLSDFHRKGLIQLTGTSLILPNPSKLKALLT